MSDPTEGHVEQGDGPDRRPGTTDGTSTLVEEVWGRSSSRGGRPGATAVIDNDSTKVVAFEFAEGDELKEHAARHPVLIQVVLGSATMPVADLMKLGRGAIVPLDHRVGEPVDITVNGRVVARGEIVVVEEDNSRFGVSLTEIVGPADSGQND